MLTKHQQLLFAKQAEIAKAIGHPLRLAIVDFLKDGPQCVCDIAERIGAERSNVSRHLSVMVAAGVLEHRKQGLKVIYWLKCSCIVDFFSCISGVLKQQAAENRKLLAAL
ncbi:MAG: metalloregulator ArsR/SmtB family transcription factor [Planctomycetota bacterium]|nr:metalloregulator ArsR/SmtB family transcription factor [Planctomycetota bacterium]